MTDEDAEDLAVSILSGMDFFAYYVTKTEEAQLDEMEMEELVKPLSRILKRMSPKNLDKVRTFSDPALLAIGLGMYFARVYPLVKARQDAVRHNRLSKKPAEPTGQANSDGF